MLTKYLPSAMSSKTKLPSLLATENLTTDESFALKRLTVADSTIFWLPSITRPVIFPFDCARPAIEATRTASKVIIFLICIVLVLVLNNYRSKVGTMQCQDHCFKIN